MNGTSPDPSGKKVLLVIGNASRRNLRANVFRDVGIEVSMGAVALFLTLCLTVIFWMFRTGYRLKN